MTGAHPADNNAVDPDRQQRRASDPVASVWVGASAGSGKTKVLTDRVLRLLLSGTQPQRLLCLTFTKAAAAEMANRVNLSLGEWATAPDDALREKLARLTGAPPADAAVGMARRLFARVLDVPGGLKIQTIHSFCESLLGRFPIEADVPPHFQVMDERSAAELLRAARDDVLAAALGDDESRAALETLTAYLHEDRFSELLHGLLTQRGRLRWLIGEDGSLAAARDAVYRTLGIDAGVTKSGLVAAACQDGTFDRAGLKAAAEALLGGTKSFQPRGRLLADWLAEDRPGRVHRFDEYLRVFLTGQLTVYANLVDKKSGEQNPAALAALEREAERVSAVLEQCRTAATAQATAALLQLGGAILRAYARAKSLRVQFDYDDLIYKARDLLRSDRDGQAAWVLFKLDGGLDHVLIDEAQDTNPDQWEVVAAMADEFFAGMGARDVDRTIFAVGDTKQSIFSFQRAEPAFFRAYREYFEKRTTDAGKGWDTVDLDISFRSAPSVLHAVDAVFATDPARDGVVEPGDELRHKAYRAAQAGLVEVWPAVGPVDEGDAEWQPPVRRRDRLAPEVRLAKLVTQKLCGWIGREPLPSHGRTVRAGDVMILLRRRSGFMETLVRELKSAGVPVAGVDRMALTEQLAVMDLMALGRFLLLPEDDLTLAVVLKGPFIGFDDDKDLFPLCHGRGAASVWRRLGEMSAGNERFARAHAWLSGLLSRADQAPPFEMFARLLGGPTAVGPTGWQALLSRLGPEAEDPVDEFLTLALGYERSHVPSLQGFLQWLEAGSAEIKRDLEQTGRDEVRVMTVHGAKGLQSPIVILPDTMAVPTHSREIVWHEDVALWPPGRANENAFCRALREEAKSRDEQEHRRLLYVAMTRAEDRLYVCGWHGPRQPSPKCWYNLVHGGLSGIAEPCAFDFTTDIEGAGWAGEGLRLANGQTGEPDMIGTRTVGRETAARTEDWMLRPPKPDPTPPRPLAPSRPSSAESAAEPATLSPLGLPSGDRFHRGIVIHRLLQVLPDLPDGDRDRACRGFLARPAHGLSAEEQAEIAAEVLAALATPDFADLFGPDSMAEVPVIGTVAGPDGPEVISGQVDRLVVRESGIMILDYKTSRPPPETPERVAPAYIRQMAAYRAVLSELWPDRPVSCALLWTAVPRLMALDNRLLDRYRSAT